VKANKNTPARPQSRPLGRPESVQMHQAMTREQALASVWEGQSAPRQLPRHLSTGLIAPRLPAATAGHLAQTPEAALAAARSTTVKTSVSARATLRIRTQGDLQAPLVGAARRLPLMAALMLAGTLGQAAAQEISTSLPLTSVGDKLLWSVGDQTLTLTVPSSGPVKLELYSPQLDPADYRSDSYYGDETYDRSPVSTTFELVGEDGAVVAQRSYAPGVQSWDTLFDQTLAAGTYKLRASTAGNGKNTFALRLSGSASSISAERLAVNIHSQVFVPVLNVSTDGAGYALQMYDGDGKTELEAQLRDASGKVTPLTVSEQRGNVSIKLPDEAGQYQVELRQPTGARQYSNTVGFSLVRDEAPRPITLTSVDTLGLLRVEAELLLPGGAVPTSLPVQVGSETVQAEPSLTKRPAGTYPVKAPEVPGAEVSVPAEVTVKKGETALVKVQVKPRVTLSLVADKQQVCVGDVVRFTARATTEYAGDLPLDLSLSSDALTLPDGATKTGTLSAGSPAEISVEAIATAAGDFSVLAKLAPWADMMAVGVKVLPDATNLELRRAALKAANPGDVVTISLSLSNTGPAAQSFDLRDAPGTGLQVLGTATFRGVLKAGESRDFSYRARVTGAGGSFSPVQATLTGGSVGGVPCGVPQTADGTQEVLKPVVANPAPSVSRRSTVSLPFEAPVQARSLIVSHRFPPEASYTPGSSKLNSQSISDPVQGPSGTVYWTLPTPQATPAAGNREVVGVVTYELTHSGELSPLARPALSANYDRERRETLQGVFDLKDYSAAQPLTPSGQAPAAPSENVGSIKLPLSGTVFRERDRITVAVQGPLNTVLAPTINGQPISEKQIGTRITDPGSNTQRLEYVGVPIVPGRNVIALGGETQVVYLAGPTARVTFTPLQTVADGSTPLRFKVLATDAAGQGSSERFLSLGTSLEPKAPDASPSDAGYQVALQDGVGELVLQPQPGPTALDLSVQLAGKVQTSRYQITPDSSRVGVGLLSATVGLNGGFSTDNILLAARAYYEGPLAGGKLYVAADKDGLPTSTNPYLRYPAYGDSSTQTVPLQGIDPVALSYDHPAFRVQYRQDALPITVFGLGNNLTALSGFSKSNPSVAGFVAAVPGDLKSETLTPDGTRLLRLKQGGEVQDSESLQLIVSRNGQELSRSPLARYVDYTLDPLSGVITLTRGLDSLDAQLNDLKVLVSYRLADPKAGRTLAYGAETRYQGQNFSVGAAVVSLDGSLTTGVRAAYDSGAVQASGLAAYSGGVQLAADLSARVGDTTASAQARYQDATYGGVGAFGAGATLRANVSTRLTSSLGLLADAEYHALPAGQGQIGQSAVGKPLDNTGGSVALRADYRLQPFNVGAGLRYAFGDVNGLGVVGSAGYHQAPFDVDLKHTQPLSGNLKPVSEFSARAAIGKATVGLIDTFTWGGDNVAALTLGTSLGNTNYAVSYELPTASGAGNRARFGVDTTLPLSEQLTLGLRGSASRDIGLGQNQVSVGADVRFQSSALSATLGGDVAFQAGVLNTVLRGGVSGSLNRNLTLTADGALQLSAATPGARAAIGYAYRSGPWNSLGYVRYAQGSLAGSAPELSAGASAEFHVPHYAVRAGIDSRTLLNDPGSFTYQPSVGGTYYFADQQGVGSFGIGAWGRALLQPSSGASQVGFGLEGSVRALPGTWISVGYNFAGFDGLSGQSGAYTKKGLYLRLDLTLDESELGEKK
jgi:hypothetical protein